MLNTTFGMEPAAPTEINREGSGERKFGIFPMGKSMEVAVFG